MQSLNSVTIQQTRRLKIDKLETEMREVIVSNVGGALFVCPYCNYSSRKNPNGSAKVFQNKFFKCFCCGKWRAL